MNQAVSSPSLIMCGFFFQTFVPIFVIAIDAAIRIAAAMLRLDARPVPARS